MEPRLSLVTLDVADLARAIAFYEGLGWQRALKTAEGVAFFQLGGAALSLYPFEDLAADAGLSAAPLPAFRRLALAHNVRTREEVDALAAAVATLGGAIVKPPEEKSRGG